MKRRSLFFKGPGDLGISEESLPDPAPSEVLVKTLYSAISHGTEMLFYRGWFPEDLALDETIPALQQRQHYPLKYGYAAVGEITAVGKEVSRDFVGRAVFCLHPHESHFTAGIDEVFPLPPDIDVQDAIFLANMETAVNCLMDGCPVIGEKVAVFGQGVVGLLAAALLARFPLTALLTLDRFKLRREASRGIGAQLALDSELSDALSTAIEWLEPGASEGTADLVYELSGDPGALNAAIALTGFDGRIVIGSWYGTKKAPLDLGRRFHRRRIRLIGSQVSTLTPALSARWSRLRRLNTACDMVGRIRPSRFITHQFPFDRAPEAFELIDNDPASTIQVVLDYERG